MVSSICPNTGLPVIECDTCGDTDDRQSLSAYLLDVVEMFDQGIWPCPICDAINNDPRGRCSGCGKDWEFPQQ